MQLTKKQRRSLRQIVIAGGVFAVLSLLALCGVLPATWYVRLPLFLIPYFVVGFGVWKKAVQTLARGQLLDENFLMCIATVGALVLGEYPEAVFVMLFYRVGELFESIAVGKSRRSIAALMDIRPDEARVEREGEESIVSPEEVACGEIIIVRAGEKIPLDGVILEGESALDTLSLTGESLPKDVKAGDTVANGCINIRGLLRIRVTRPFEESTVSKILALVENSTLVKSKAENAVTRFAHWYTPLVVVSAVLLAVIPSLITGEWHRWLKTALIFLVVSCPCALVISVPLSYFGGLGCASRHGILVKGANRLEMLADTDMLVMDKTGTLTKGHFSVTKIETRGDVRESELLRLCASVEQHSNHPIARSILEASREASLALLTVSDVRELAGMGVCATVDGREITVGNATLMQSRGYNSEMQDHADTVVYVAAEGVLLGSITVADTPKPEAKGAIERMRRAGVRRTVMLTGDREEIAARVARELGIDEYRASLLPADKVTEIEKSLRDANGTVVFVGDGVNDAPVLARADVGIAMGALGSDAAIEAADVVLMDDRLTGISDAVTIARFTKRIVIENVIFALSVKAVFLALSVLGMTNMWAASFADVGVAVLAILNAMRTLHYRVQH